MAYQIPFSNKNGIRFDYLGTNRFSKLRWNCYMQCWVTDYTFEDDTTVYSLALRAGVNCLRQFNIPYSIYVVNNFNSAIDPGNISSLSAYILEEGDVADLVTYKNPNPGGIS